MALGVGQTYQSFLGSRPRLIESGLPVSGGPLGAIASFMGVGSGSRIPAGQSSFGVDMGSMDPRQQREVQNAFIGAPSDRAAIQERRDLAERQARREAVAERSRQIDDEVQRRRQAREDEQQDRREEYAAHDREMAQRRADQQRREQDEIAGRRFAQTAVQKRLQDRSNQVTQLKTAYAAEYGDDALRALEKRVADQVKLAVGPQGLGYKDTQRVWLLIFAGMAPEDAVNQVAATRSSPDPDRSKEMEKDFASRGMSVPRPFRGPLSGHLS